MPLTSPRKRSRAFDEADLHARRSKRHRSNTTTARKDCFEQHRTSDTGSTALTAESLREVPRESVKERVGRWETRETARRRIVSSVGSGSRSNPRKRSRKSASTVATASSLPTSITSERTSMYDKVASDVLMDNNIYGPSYCVDPANKQALEAELGRARRSLSPSVYPESNFEQFRRANHKALNEGQLVSEVIHPYLTSYFDHTATTNLAFTNLDPVVPPPLSMPAPKPDHSFGAAKEDIHTAVRRSLGPYIVCAPGAHTPAAVNDMMQVKGPDGKNSVLEAQITLDGAVGERAIHKLRSYAVGSEARADSIARTFAQTYHAGTMKFYTTHRLPAPSGPDRIYTTEIGGQYLCGSPAQLRDGITKYRNCVELATKYRREAVAAANTRALAAENGAESGDEDDEDEEEFYEVAE